uniref:peptide-methionine (S)-S-oxide reductase n=1 Tax=Myotis myotis TaxID=51298 RepID=A0A7J7XII1_MYOMY|nr:methionine sulfoxide reductase A [Myotis myotis]
MAVFGMGCFWGAERKFWTLKGVYSTQVGYAGGYTSNPTYQEVCSGKTGHAEVVRVAYQPEHISFEELLKVFWENHDPTQGMRQGNDHGSQYRSAIYPTSASHMEVALRSKEDYQKVASAEGAWSGAGTGTSPALMGWKPVASLCARPAVGHFLSILVPSRKAPPSFSCCLHLLPLPGCVPFGLLPSPAWHSPLGVGNTQPDQHGP